MNKLRTLLTWGLLSAAAHVMGYSLTVSPIEIEAGQSTNLIINLNDAEPNFTAYQMMVYLPEGVTVQKKANGKYAYTANADRHDGAFTFTVKDAADGSVLIAVFSADKDVITGTSGELIRLPLEVASSVTTSLQGSIKNIELSDVNGKAYNPADVNFTMTLKGGSTPPDVSGNVTVSVPDIEMTAGSTTNLIVNMQTDLTNLTAYQMKLFLPTGVTVQKKSNGKYAYTANADRHDGAFTFTVKDAADGSVLIAVFSADKDVITGTSGELIRLPLEVASTVTTSLQGSLKEIEFTDVNSQAYTISDVNFTLTINEATEPNITFEDANVKAICVANWDTNGDGKLSEKEAAAVTNLGEVFKGNTTITSFDELQYFTGLDSIGYYAFGGCSSLASVKIPNSVTNIGEYAFEGCGSLTSITIPKSVTSIGDLAFSYCSGLASMVVESGNPKYDSRDNCNAIIETAKNDLRAGCKNTIIPNGIARIRKGAFCGCSGLVSIAIPEGVTSIGYRTFADCSSLTAINIPEGVTSITGCTFENCRSLKSVTIPSSIPSIGKGAFAGCGSLSSITCYAENVPLAGDSIFYNVKTSAVTLYVPAGSLEAYRTTAPWSSFGNIVAIEEPSPVIAFADANVKAICVANWDTDGDGELSKAEAAAVTDLGDVFISNTEITSFNELQFFTGLTSIGDDAFYGCSSLTSITIPNRVTSIGSSAFGECTSLTSITIPSSVTSIGDGAFFGCSSLTSVTIGNSVTSIGGQAFYNCIGLTSITIPGSVTSIGSGAFGYCRLRNILLKCITPPELEWLDPSGRDVEGTFSPQSMRHATLYVPSGCWETYVFDEIWFVFNNIRETATEEAQISMQQAYTLMDAGTFTYSVYDPVNDRISSVNVINEDNPNHCWQVIDVDGERYLYNIGAKKFVTTAGDYMRLSGNATSIEMQNGNDGIVLGEQKGRQWAFVNNDNMNVEDAIADMIKGITPTFTEDDAAVYNLAGQRLSKPQKGINIKNGKKYLVK